MEDYEITRDGRLRRQRHTYKVVKTHRQFPSSHLKSIKSWWTTVSDAHGDVLIYTSDDTDERGPQWVEFRVRFTNGRVQDGEDQSRARCASSRARRGTRVACGHVAPSRARFVGAGAFGSQSDESMPRGVAMWFLQ